ncbi:MAG: hypothetical protein JWQ48_2211 [Conexibacter sp.]|jgi:hypothetical protein|nr:hypothetical protein [Conexibacter sp.]
MTIPRVARIIPAAGAALLLLAATAPAADAPSATISGSVSPNAFGALRNGVGHSLALTLKGTVVRNASEASPILTNMVLSLPTNAVANGRLFPSCSAATLNRGHGRPSACPKGAQLGGGPATAHVHGIGIDVRGRLNVWNGPGGKSVVMQAIFTQPADINISFDAPLIKTSGRYGYRTIIDIPSTLRDILPDSQAGLTSFDVRLRATTTQTVKGKKVKRGYIEPTSCPKTRDLPLHADYRYLEGSTTSADSTIHVSCT